MTATGPFRMLASRRTDLLIVPFEHMHHMALDHRNRASALNPSQTDDLVGYFTAMGYVARNLVQTTRILGRSVVLYYTNEDLVNSPQFSGQPMRCRLKGGIDLRFQVPALVVETEGKIHVLKDRNLVLKPLIKAIYKEAPEMIGENPYSGLDA